MRVVHNGGARVYDSELNDWFGFTDPNEGLAWASEADEHAAAPQLVQDVGAPRIGTGTFTVPDSGSAFTVPYLLLPTDPSRARAIISATAFGSELTADCLCCVGTLQDAQVGKGLILHVTSTNTALVVLETTEAIWAVGVRAVPATTFGQFRLSVLAEYDNGH